MHVQVNACMHVHVNECTWCVWVYRHMWWGKWYSGNSHSRVSAMLVSSFTCERRCLVTCPGSHGLKQSPPPARVWGGLLLPYAQQEELELPTSCVCQIHRLSHFGNSKVISSMSVANFSVKGRLCTMSFSCQLLAEWVWASTTWRRGIEEGLKCAIESYVFPKWNDPGVKKNPSAFGHPSPICVSPTTLFFYPDSFCNKKPETLGKTKGGKSNGKPSYRDLIGTQKPFHALSLPNQKEKEMQLIRRKFTRCWAKNPNPMILRALVAQSSCCLWIPRTTNFSMTSGLMNQRIEEEPRVEAYFLNPILRKLFDLLCFILLL